MMNAKESLSQWLKEVYALMDYGSRPTKACEEWLKGQYESGVSARKAASNLRVYEFHGGN